MATRIRNMPKKHSRASRTLETHQASDATPAMKPIEIKYRTIGIASPLKELWDTYKVKLRGRDTQSYTDNYALYYLLGKVAGELGFSLPPLSELRALGIDLGMRARMVSEK